MKQILLYLVLVASMVKCSKTKENENKSISSNLPSVDSVSIDIKTKQLIETVLNLPSILNFSKIDLIQKKYGPVSIYFNQNTIADNLVSILQQGKPLEILHGVDSNSSETKPCYVFQKITIDNNDAYVLVTFDITGCLAYGKLEYINGIWVPDKEFKIGVR